MADITMCSGERCPKKKRCYRYTAPVTPHWQAYFTEVPYDPISKTCEHFWRTYKKTTYEPKEIKTR